ncbi:MAG: ybaK [Cyanobacteria bacterium RYN_339]|nr:ybaK [Cyanobacteria bacterium RYN_339]
MKTNAVRTLDAAKVAYDLAPYEVDEDDLSAETVAAKIGWPVEKVFKTLAVRGDKTGVVLAVIATPQTLDLKALATASGNKRCELLPLAEVLPVTGYVRGGVSPIGTKKKFAVYLDESARAFEAISVSAGARGLQLLISPVALAAVTQASWASVGR